jgi:hypothetical protein
VTPPGRDSRLGSCRPGAEKLAAAKERWLVLQEELTALDQA